MPDTQTRDTDFSVAVEDVVSIGSRIRTYWNLHKDCYSIVYAEGSNYGRVAGYLTTPFLLKDVEFRVQEATRQRIIENGTRDICGYAVGYIQSLAHKTPKEIGGMKDEGIDVLFDPFTQDCFVDEHGNIVEQTAKLLCTVNFDRVSPRIQIVS